MREQSRRVAGVSHRRAVGLAGLLVLALVLLPLAVRASVELAWFEGQWTGSSVLLDWGTGSEIDHLGFNLYRHTTDLLPADVVTQATKLNDELISSNTACTPFGNVYAWEDTTVDPGEDEYHYWLESFNCTGGSDIDPDAHVVVKLGSETATPTATTTAAVTLTSTPTASTTAIATLTPTGTQTMPATVTPSPTGTQTGSETVTPSPTATQTGVASATPTATPTSTTTATPTATRTPTATATTEPQRVLCMPLVQR